MFAHPNALFPLKSSRSSSVLSGLKVGKSTKILAAAGIFGAQVGFLTWETWWRCLKFSASKALYGGLGGNQLV